MVYGSLEACQLIECLSYISIFWCVPTLISNYSISNFSIV